MKMKNLKSLFSLATLLIVLATSCNNSVPDSITSKSYDISDFSSLNLELIGDVFYEQSDSLYLIISGSSNLIEALNVSDSRGELSIDLNNKRKYSGSKKELVIKVGSPHLEEIIFKSVGTLHLKNHFNGDKLNIENKGVGEIKIDDCHVETFNLNSKSVGIVEVKGSSNQTTIHSEGIGKMDFSEFKSKNTKVESKGAGTLSIYATESIDVSISGMGTVEYYGNPTEVKTDISGMGKITRMDQ